MYFVALLHKTRFLQQLLGSIDNVVINQIMGLQKNFVDSNKPMLGTHILVPVHVLLDVVLNNEEPGDGGEHSVVDGNGCRKGTL